MNIVIDQLPQHLSINGCDYPIHTDFRNWIRFELLMLDHTMSPEEKTLKLLPLCFTTLPPTLQSAISAMIGFYVGTDTKTTQSSDTNTKPVYSFTHDADYIYAAFFTQYQIDLQSANLHWWQFKALFKSLNESNKICKVMEYRAIDLSQIKDKEQKKFYRKMKAVYRLPDHRTEAEKEKAMIDSMANLF